MEYKSDDLTHPTRNVYGKGIHEILMRTEIGINSGQPFYYQQDHEGSVTHLTNASGNVIESYRYDAFGAPNHAPGYNNRFLFTGREYNATFAFYEYRVRAYHPVLGRFMSEAPTLFDAGDYNLFRYCHNDPEDMTDPMGLVPTGFIWIPTPDRVQDWAAHHTVSERITLWQVAKESSIAGENASRALQNLSMAQISQSEGKMYTYSLKSQYNIGDLSGARVYQYAWDPNEKCSGQCLTGVQHLTGTPSSKTPLVAGASVGPTTRQGAAIAMGWKEDASGQLRYPSKPASLSNNHAAIFVAPIANGHMQILSQWAGTPLHFDTVPMAGWNVITSRLPATNASTSELRPWGP